MSTRGRITGLIGPNGAGKTTLFNLISGALEPSGGRIFFAGGGAGHSVDITGMAMHQTFALGLVRTFQIPREMKLMTVLENLMLVPAGQRGGKVVGVVVYAVAGGAAGTGNRGPRVGCFGVRQAVAFGR